MGHPRTVSTPVTSTKVCEECSVERPTAAFLPTSGTPDGLTRRCRACVIGGWRREEERRASRLASRESARPTR